MYIQFYIHSEELISTNKQHHIEKNNLFSPIFTVQWRRKNNNSLQERN